MCRSVPNDSEVWWIKLFCLFNIAQQSLALISAGNVLFHMLGKKRDEVN